MRPCRSRHGHRRRALFDDVAEAVQQALAFAVLGQVLKGALCAHDAAVGITYRLPQGAHPFALTFGVDEGQFIVVGDAPFDAVIE